MKKILAVSLVAIMAAGAARADIASTTYVQKKISNLDAAEIMAENEVIMSVSETDGIISATTGKITESHLDFDVATQDELDAEIGTYDAATKTGTGLKKQVGDIEEKLKSVATTEGLGNLTTQVEENTKAIATYEDGNLTGGLTKDVEDINANIGNVDDLASEAETLVSAINEVKGIADTNATVIATYDAQGKLEGGLKKDVADINANIGTVAHLGTAEKTLVPAINEVKGIADGAIVRIGGIDADGTKTGLVAEIAAAQDTADEAIAAIGGTDEDGTKTGLVAEIAAVQETADANATAIATYDDQGNLTGGLTKDVEDIETNIGTVANLATEATTLVPAINEVKGIADGAASAAATAQSAAEAAQADADANALAIATYDEDGNLTGGLTKQVEDNTEAIATYDDQGNLTGGLKKDVAVAQATADSKVDKASLGISDENPFVVPDWCKSGGVVCSFVVLDGVAGWQKVVDEDPVEEPAA